MSALIRSRFTCAVVVLCLLLFLRDVTCGDEPATTAKEQGPWTIKLELGNDAPEWGYGYPFATITVVSDGHIQIDQVLRRPTRTVVAYQNEDVSQPLLRLIHEVAEAALKETPVVEPPGREILHAYWIKLDCNTTVNSRIVHAALFEFPYAPPAIVKLIALFNGLLPAKDRSDLTPREPIVESMPGGKPLKQMIEAWRNAPQQPPKWTVFVGVARNEAHSSKPVYEGRFAANYTAKVTSGKEVLYENQALPIEDLEILHEAAQAACEEAGRTGEISDGLSVHIELLDRDGAVIGQHDETRLAELEKASPATVRVLHWINDHLAKDQRVELSPPTRDKTFVP